MPTATLTAITCETIGRPKASKYEGKPDYRPVLFVLPDGSQRWKSYNEGSPELEWLRKGQTYQAVIAGDEMTIIQPEGQPAPTAPQSQVAPTTAPTIPDDRKREIAQYMQDLGAMYAYAYSTAKHQLEPHDAPLEAVQACASSLFIAATRKFGL